MNRLRISSVIGLLGSILMAFVGFAWWMTIYCVTMEPISDCGPPAIVHYGQFTFSLSVVGLVASLVVFVLSFGQHSHVQSVNREKKKHG